ncbi:MAG: hypothetical protein KatS3mg112_0058 [Thermogutta sp.]|nr:MAG: hypothetical protein KatS3mg112_0058 [Thermogutta sp.]
MGNPDRVEVEASRHVLEDAVPVDFPVNVFQKGQNLMTGANSAVGKKFCYRCKGAADVCDFRIKSIIQIENNRFDHRSGVAQVVKRDDVATAHRSGALCGVGVTNGDGKQSRRSVRGSFPAPRRFLPHFPAEFPVMVFWRLPGKFL